MNALYFVVDTLLTLVVIVFLLRVLMPLVRAACGSTRCCSVACATCWSPCCSSTSSRC